MSSTGSLRRTDLGHATPAWTHARVATVLATLLLTVVLITFRPFAPAGAPDAPEGGDIVNQLGFGTLGVAAIFVLMTFSDRRMLQALLSPAMVVMFGFFMLSVLNATDPPSAMRAAGFTIIGVLTMAAVITAPRDADAMSTVFATSAMIVLVVCYIGLVVFPNEAMHNTDSFEPEHAGLWRGLFSHKNIAGPVMACLSFAGIYIWRRGKRALGTVIIVLAMVFMLNTGSKTTAGLVPASILLVALPGMIGMRLLTPLAFAALMVGTAFATLGIVFIEPLRHLAAEYAPGLTYTGRTALWEFGGEMIAKRPWTGYGYESFWSTMFVWTMDQPFDRDWDIRGIVHGHNGYLDIAVIMGVPALVVAVVAFLVMPLIDYMRIPLRRENVFLGDFFMMVLLFTALNAFLESFFFRRADPVWLFFVFGILGLRMVARFPVVARRP